MNAWVIPPLFGSPVQQLSTEGLNLLSSHDQRQVGLDGWVGGWYDGFWRDGWFSSLFFTRDRSAADRWRPSFVPHYTQITLFYFTFPLTTRMAIWSHQKRTSNKKEEKVCFWGRGKGDPANRMATKSVRSRKSGEQPLATVIRCWPNAGHGNSSFSGSEK